MKRVACHVRTLSSLLLVSPKTVESVSTFATDHAGIGATGKESSARSRLMKKLLVEPGNADVDNEGGGVFLGTAVAATDVPQIPQGSGARGSSTSEPCRHNGVASQSYTKDSPTQGEVALSESLRTVELLDALKSLGLVVTSPTPETATTAVDALEQLQSAALAVYLRTRQSSTNDPRSISASLSAILEHPVLVSFLQSAPSWDALERMHSHNATQTDEHLLLLHQCPTSVLLSVCSLVGQLAIISPQHQPEALDDQLWDPAARIVALWVVDNVLRHKHNPAVLSPPSHRLHHLLRSCVRLQRYFHSRSCSAHSTSLSRLSAGERLIAGASVALLLSSLADAKLALAPPERALLLCKIAEELYATCSPVPNQMPPERAKEVKHRTQHSSFNTRLAGINDVAAQGGGSGRGGSNDWPLLHLPLVLQSLLPWICQWWVVDRAVLGNLEPLACNGRSQMDTAPSLARAPGGDAARPLSPMWATKAQRHLLSVALAVESDMALLSTLCFPLPMSASAAPPQSSASPSAAGQMCARWTPQPLPVLMVQFHQHCPVDPHLTTARNVRNERCDALASLRKSLASAVRTIVWRLTIPEEPQNGHHREHLTVPVQVHPLCPRSRATGEEVLCPKACVFLESLRHSFGSLARRHYACSGGTEVLIDAVDAFFLACMAGEQLHPVQQRRKDPRYVRRCPSSHSVGEAMEMLFFSTLVHQQEDGNTPTEVPKVGDNELRIRVNSWVEPSKRLLRFIIDALVLNTIRFEQEVRRGGSHGTAEEAKSPLDSMLFLTPHQHKHPTLCELPLWQAVEFIAVLRHHVGTLSDIEQSTTTSDLDPASSAAGAHPPHGVMFASLRAPNSRHDSEEHSNLPMLRKRLAKRVQDMVSAGVQMQEGVGRRQSGKKASHRTAIKLSDLRGRGSRWDQRTIAKLRTDFTNFENCAASDLGSVHGELIGLARIKHLTALAAGLGINFNTEDEQRMRRHQKRQTQTGQAHHEGDPNVSSLPSPTEGKGSSHMTAMVSRRSPSESFGFHTNDQCIIHTVARSSPFAAAMAVLGWYPADCCRRTLKIVRVNGWKIAHVDDLRRALLAEQQRSSRDGSMVTRIELVVITSERRDDGGGGDSVIHRRAVPPIQRLSALEADDGSEVPSASPNQFLT